MKSKSIQVHPTPRKSDSMHHIRTAEHIISAKETNTLASFSAVVGRVSIYLLLALATFVPSLVYKATYVGSILAGAMTGVAAVLPITLLVLRAVPSAKTPKLVLELTAILACVAFTIMRYITRAPNLRGMSGFGNDRWPQAFLSLFAAAALTIPIVIALRRATSFRDRRRAQLCLATAIWAPSFYVPAVLGPLPPLLSTVFQYVTMACAWFLGASLFLDRSDHMIEHSVPYAACYGWGLPASMVGFLIILRIKTLPAIVLSMILSVYSAFLLWCFSQLSNRITTVRDQNSFILPGFFAVTLFQVQPQ
jgi:hypothetical protein